MTLNRNILDFFVRLLITFYFSLFVQSFILLKYLCSFAIVSLLFFPTILFSGVGILIVQSTYRTRPNTLPCEPLFVTSSNICLKDLCILWREQEFLFKHKPLNVYSQIQTGELESLLFSLLFLNFLWVCFLTVWS